ncbi:MAG: tetratricopeptide repeat protein [Proteobacteria bacterium]|nr:tetratricopeptide repeat protein [Pseudomonadota bacterium]
MMLDVLIHIAQDSYIYLRNAVAQKAVALRAVALRAVAQSASVRGESVVGMCADGAESLSPEGRCPEGRCPESLSCYRGHQPSRYIILTAAVVCIFLLTAVVNPLVNAQSLNRKESTIGLKEESRFQRSASSPTRSGRPSISRSAIIASTVEGKLIKGIKRTLQQMRSIADRQPKGSEAKLKIMERMLRLQLEQASYVTSQEDGIFQKKWDNWNAKGRRGAEPKLIHQKSNRMWIQYVKISTAIIKEFPKNKKLDEVIFFKALALQFLNKQDESARTLSNLIQRFPNSSRTGDAYYSLGDYYFEKNQYQQAEKHYTKVITVHKSSDFYDQALYQLGWTYYNLNNYRKALIYWKRTITRTKGGDKVKQNLREIALRDIILAFAEIGNVPSALSYFRSQGENRYVAKFLKMLADILVDQGKYAKAVEVFHKLQNHSPESEEAPEAQAALIHLTYQLGNYNSLWKELKLYYVRYGLKSPWAKRNTQNRRLVLETQKNIRDQILYYSKITHKNAQKQRSRAHNLEAEKGYKLYLSSFPKSNQATEIKFNLADLHYFRKEFGTAGKLYFEVASMGKNKAFIINEEGKRIKNIHKDSAKYMLDSYYKDFEPELKKILANKAPYDIKKPKRKLSYKANNFIKACGSYLKWYPRDPKVKKNCDVYLAEIYYRHNDSKNAITYLLVVARRYPGTKEGMKAVTSLLPLLQNDKKGLNLALLEFTKNPAYNKGSLGKKMKDLLRGVNEETVNKEKDLTKRAKGFLKLASDWPNSPQVYKYYYNAAVMFMKANDYPSAIKADYVVMTRFKAVPEAKESLLRMAQMSESIIEYDNARKYYLLYVNRYPQSKEAAEAMQQACDLSIILYDEPNKVLQSCSGLRKYNPAAYLARVEDVIMTLYANKEFGRMNQVIDVYNRLPGVTVTQRVKMAHRQFVANNRNGGAQNPHAKRILSLYTSSASAATADAASRQAVAEILFFRSMEEVRRYEQVTLKGGQLSNLEQTIQMKTAGLERLLRSFSAVINTRDAYWGVAAQYQMALAWQQLADQYSSPPAIQGAKIADVKKQLAPQAKQAYSKAQGIFQSAFRDSQKFHVYSDHSRLIAQAVNTGKNSQVTTDDWVVQPDFIGSPISSGLSEALR